MALPPGTSRALALHRHAGAAGSALTMFKFFYQWRHRRREKEGAFKLPAEDRRGGILRTNFGNYLSQSSVRGRHFDRFDLPQKRRRRIRRLLLVAGSTLLLWLVVESVNALVFLSR